MKRTALVILAVFTLGALAVPAAASHTKEFKVIQNAVKRDRTADAPKTRGRDIRWLKVLIRDGDGEGAEIRLSLPIPLIKIVLDGCDARRFKVDDDHCEIDLRAVWKALKKAGPRALVEIRDGGSLFKIWFE
jgi:hypothetical protein